MPRQLEDIHVNCRRIGNLKEKDPFAWNFPNGFRVILSNQGMKTVKNEPDIRMVAFIDDIPCLGNIPDVLTPGKRLVADTEAARHGHVTQPCEIFDNSPHIIH